MIRPRTIGAALAGVAIAVSMSACYSPNNADSRFVYMTNPQTGERITPPDEPMMAPDLTSGLTIPPSETFLLGGDRGGPYKAFIRNRGNVPVEIYLERLGSTYLLGTLQPGERTAAAFDTREGANLKNLSASQEAFLKVEVFGDTNIGMRYIENAEFDQRLN